MGYYLGAVDHEKNFDSLTHTPVFVNDFSPETIEGREKLSQLLTTTYDGDTIESVPKCACADNPTRGVANKGKICPQCNTVVEDIFGSDINALVWIRPPETISHLCNPIIWSLLQEHFSKSDTSFISWFANKDYKYNPDHQPLIDNLRNAGFDRGWTSFVANYKEIVTYLHNNNYGKTADSKLATKIRRDFVYKMLMQNYKVTFTKYLPIPNRIAFVTETTTAGKVVDPSQVECLDAIRAVCSVSGENVTQSQRVIENRVFRFHEQISNYYKVNYKDIIGRKEGMSRHHVFGSRLEFTARGVITSISNTHDYDECHMPWTMAIGLFRIHINNKLDKRGYTPRERSRKLALAANHFDQEVADILNELIEESPYGTLRSGMKGIPIILQRNPTLDRLSAQLLYVTKFKSDNLEDNTIGLSVLVLKGPNADFDGDALNLLLITDKVMYEQFYNMSTHLGIQDLHKPRSVSSIVNIPAPTCSTIGSYFAEHENLMEQAQ